MVIVIVNQNNNNNITINKIKNKPHEQFQHISELSFNFNTRKNTESIIRMQMAIPWWNNLLLSSNLLATFSIF